MFVTARRIGRKQWERFLRIALEHPVLISAVLQWESQFKGCENLLEPLCTLQGALEQNTRDYHNFPYNCFYNNKTT